MITREQLYVCILFIHMYCTLRVLCKNKKICLTDMTCSVTLSLRWINKCIATCFVSSRALITSGIFLGHIPKVKVNSNSCSIYPCSRQLTKRVSPLDSNLLFVFSLHLLPRFRYEVFLF